MKKLFFASVLALSAALAAAPAAAVLYMKTATQTINYNVAFTSETQYNNNPTSQITSFQPFSFSIAKFNPLGSNGQALTLTNVKISVSSQLGGSVTLINGSANARIGDLQYKIGNSFTIDLPGTSDFVVSTSPGNGALLPFNIPRQSQGTLGFGSTNTASSGNFTPASFVPYIGSGNYTVTHSLANLFSDVTLTTGGKGNLRGEANANVNGSFTIEYSYLDPIPEPTSWAMLMAGFGLAGAAARRSRAVIA